MIHYDDHALLQMKRRGIDKTWVVQALQHPDFIERSGRRSSYLKSVAGRRVMLRVVTPFDDPTFVITAYFDRKKPCA